MSLFRTLKRLMSTFRISYFPHFLLSAFPTFRISYLCVLMLAESGSLKSHKITSRNVVGSEP